MADEQQEQPREQQPAPRVEGKREGASEKAQEQRGSGGSRPNREGGRPSGGREAPNREGGRPGGSREGARPGDDRRSDRRPEAFGDLDIEKLISDPLYLDNQAHSIVSRMRDMDSGTRSQLRRFYNAVRRACRAPEKLR